MINIMYNIISHIILILYILYSYFIYMCKQNKFDT